MGVRARSYSGWCPTILATERASVGHPAPRRAPPTGADDASPGSPGPSTPATAATRWRHGGRWPTPTLRAGRRPRGPGPARARSASSTGGGLADPAPAVRRRAAESAAGGRGPDGAARRRCGGARRPRPAGRRSGLLGAGRTGGRRGWSGDLAAVAGVPRRPPVPGGRGGRPRRPGRPRGLAAVVGALGDKPTVRRGRPWPWPPSRGPRSTRPPTVPGRPRLAGPPGRRDPAGARRRAPSALSDRRRRTSGGACRRTRCSGRRPSTTHSSGASTRCTGTEVPSASRWLMPRSSAPPPTRWMPSKMMSWASSGGASPRQVAAAATIWATWSSKAPRTSSGPRTHRLGHARWRPPAPGSRPAARPRRGGPSRWPASPPRPCARRWPRRGRCGRRSGWRRRSRTRRSGWPAWPPPRRAR